MSGPNSVEDKINFKSNSFNIDADPFNNFIVMSYGNEQISVRKKTFFFFKTTNSYI
jgi:hypothetical protein